MVRQLRCLVVLLVAKVFVAVEGLALESKRQVTTCKAGKKILVVVDVQNDYCKDCQNGTANSPWAQPIAELSTRIGEEVKSGKYDLIVFTQDSLAGNAWAAEKNLLQPETEGIKVVSEIWKEIPPKTEILVFEKDTDNWMIRAEPPPEMFDADFDQSVIENDAYGTRKWLRDTHFDLGNKRHRDGAERPLDLLLRDADLRRKRQGSFFLDNDRQQHHVGRAAEYKIDMHNFDPESSEIVVTGIMRTRCVMKGAIAARFYGWKHVGVVEDLTGLADEDGKTWGEPHKLTFGSSVDVLVSLRDGNESTFRADPLKQLQSLSQEKIKLTTPPSSKCITREEKADCKHGSVAHRKWLLNVAMGYKSGPKLEDVPAYLATAGIRFF